MMCILCEIMAILVITFMDITYLELLTVLLEC